MRWYVRTPETWNEILKLIAETRVGNKTLQKFLPHYRSGRIKIEPYPQNIRNQLLTVSASTTTPLGALFVTDGTQGTIYADLLGETGILVPFLYHEIIHSLDETLWRAAKRPVSTRKKQDLIFQSECRAFHAQHLLIVELTTQYPDLKKFYRDKYPQVSFLNRALSPSEIARLYSQISLLI